MEKGQGSQGEYSNGFELDISPLKCVVMQEGVEKEVGISGGTVRYIDDIYSFPGWYYYPNEQMLYPVEEDSITESYGFVRVPFDPETGKEGEPELVSWV